MVAADHWLRGPTMREMREDWLTTQLETLEESVKEERQRLQEAKRHQAMMALLSVSLPELIRESSDPQTHTIKQPLFH